MRPAGKTNCHAQSVAACGYLRSSASGNTRAEPGRKIRVMQTPNVDEIPLKRLAHGVRRHHAPILLLLAASHGDLTTLEIGFTRGFTDIKGA
jgi:hypothetical protein